MQVGWRYVMALLPIKRKSPSDELAGTLAKVLETLSHKLTADTSDSTKSAPKAATPAGVNPAADADKLIAGMDAIRKSLSTYGAALGAIASAILLGLGWATLNTIFPVRQQHTWAYLVLVVALAAIAVLSVLSLVSRLFSAQRRIVFTPSLINGAPSVPAREDPEGDKSLGNDRELAKKILQDHATEANADSIESLELRMLRLNRVAASIGDNPATTFKAQRDILQKEADELDARISIAAVRASVAVLETRAEAVFKPRPSGYLLAATGLAIIGLFITADFSKGQRDLVDLQQKCITAQKDSLTASSCHDLGVPKNYSKPKSSSASTAKPTSTATPTADTAVMDRLVSCQAKVKKTSLPPVVLQSALAKCAGIATSSSQASPAS